LALGKIEIICELLPLLASPSSGPHLYKRKRAAKDDKKIQTKAAGDQLLLKGRGVNGDVEIVVAGIDAPIACVEHGERGLRLVDAGPRLEAADYLQELEVPRRGVVAMRQGPPDLGPPRQIEGGGQHTDNSVRDVIEEDCLPDDPNGKLSIAGKSMPKQASNKTANRVRAN